MSSRLPSFSRPAWEPTLPKAVRKSQGVYYTPPEIVRQIIELTVAPLVRDESLDRRSLRILDPSCGAGEFLVEAFERVSASIGREAARRAVWGIDIDPAAVQTAQARLLALDAKFPVGQIICDDVITATSLPVKSFDAVVGNPPYINIRQVAKSRSVEQVDALRKAFSTARGNFDLYVVFIERAIELLRPAGRCGFIIPGKWATLDYARECRTLLLSKTTIERVIDLSDSKIFAAASVYPHILVFEKSIADASHAICVDRAGNQKPIQVRQAGLSAAAIQLSPRLEVESRVATQRLGVLTTITCGTAGYAAQTIANRIVEASKSGQEGNGDGADFITSGNIDRYMIRLGDVRYLNRKYSRPKLPLNSPELTPAKRELFGSSKIVVAGMCRRLEAAWDGSGLALGVQVFALSDCQADPFYLLGLLNSKLLSYLFATRFAAKRLGNGYLAINKGQLVQLPVRVFSAKKPAAIRNVRQIARLAKNWLPEHDSSIDRLVYELYRVTDDEIARIEGHFADSNASRAA